jgi:hypothetical protein
MKTPAAPRSPSPVLLQAARLNAMRIMIIARREIFFGFVFGLKDTCRFMVDILSVE